MRQHLANQANDSKYGLGGAVWTMNVARAHRVARDTRAGVFWVNCHHRNDPSCPWGGFKESGIGRENGWEARPSKGPLPSCSHASPCAPASLALLCSSPPYSSTSITRHSTAAARAR